MTTGGFILSHDVISLQSGSPGSSTLIVVDAMTSTVEFDVVRRCGVKKDSGDAESADGVSMHGEDTQGAAKMLRYIGCHGDFNSRFFCHIRYVDE
jgi:hypothetical protein